MSNSPLRLAVQFDVETYGFAVIAAVQEIASLRRGDEFTIAHPSPNGAATFGRKSSDSARHVKVWTTDHEEIMTHVQYKVVEIAHEYWSMTPEQGLEAQATDPYDALVDFMTELRQLVNKTNSERPDFRFLILCGETLDPTVMNGHCGQLLIPLDPFRTYACPRHGVTDNRIYTKYRFEVSW